MPPESRRSVPRVLITGVGGPSGICLLQALAKRPVTLLGGDIDPYAAGLYIVEPDRRAILPRGEDPRFADVVLAFCEREEVNVVVPTVDSELIPLATRRTQFEQLGVQLVLAPLETLETCLDKWALHACCEGNVRTPDTLLLDESFDATASPMPAIVKPRVGSGSRGIYRIERVEQLERFERDGSLLVQELLPGAEYSLDVLATREGRVISVVSRERLKVDSGIAVTARTRHDERLEKIGREVAELIGLRGVANVQVKEDVHGEAALLEVNPRFPGTMALTIASGPDMAWLCVADALGDAMPEQMLPFKDIAMVRFFQERFLAFEQIARLQSEPTETST
jgi:carbamoyl-phosphate synthase large subunit